ncbi:hypothetical protein [Virgibacillus profundi]|uniref:hypothetical protein n=1 Tax=Virgibacillus profundi TaxID=2024555 RepID=UPI00105475FF|nr:hypothetical protein [Virgibacillus profundi]
MKALQQDVAFFAFHLLKPTLRGFLTRGGTAITHPTENLCSEQDKDSFDSSRRIISRPKVREVYFWSDNYAPFITSNYVVFYIFYSNNKKHFSGTRNQISYLL